MVSSHRDGRQMADILRLSLWLPTIDWLCSISTTEKWTELAQLPMSYPNWSRKSDYIYFDSAGGDPAFYRVRIADRTLERLVSLKNIRRAGLFLWTGLAPDDSPLLLRDVGVEEIYALDWNAP
jgi:hypothetical protein